MTIPNMYKFQSSTHQDGMVSEFDMNHNVWRITADMTPFLRQAEQDREELAAQKAIGMSPPYQKFAVVPDICAIHINHVYGIDLHAPDYQNDLDKVKRWEQIFAALYPKLVVTT